MTLSVVPFTPEHEPAAAAFNERMRTAKAPSAFLLPIRGRALARHGQVSVAQYLAIDTAGDVRGGMLCHEYPGVIAGRPQRIMNISAPLSEGIVDGAYTFVGPLLIKYAVKQNPHAFVVGMGSGSNPLPRLLKAMGWHLLEVPFYFKLLRAAHAVRELGPLRSSAARRVAAGVAAVTGVAAVAAAALQRPSSPARRVAGRYDVLPVEQWTSSADGVWSAFASSISVGVERTTHVLPFFYPREAAGPRAWALCRDRRVVGWFGLLITHMKNNAYFGNLTVATLTDVVGDRDAILAATVLAPAQARSAGADIIITNQQHHAVRDSCIAAGWRPGPSNFLFATSKALSADVDWDRAYVTRRDGDGLVNLGG